jgi:hypothetical protein
MLLVAFLSATFAGVTGAAPSPATNTAFWTIAGWSARGALVHAQRTTADTNEEYLHIVMEAPNSASVCTPLPTARVGTLVFGASGSICNNCELWFQ